MPWPTPGVGIYKGEEKRKEWRERADFSEFHLHFFFILCLGFSSSPRHQPWLNLKTAISGRLLFSICSHVMRGKLLIILVLTTYRVETFTTTLFKAMLQGEYSPNLYFGI